MFQPAMKHSGQARESQWQEENTMAPEIPIIIMMLSAGAIIIWALVLRYKRQEMRHKERMTAIEKGAELPIEPAERPPAPWSPGVYLLRGLVWLFTGAGLSIFLLGLSFSIVPHQTTIEDRLWQANNLRRNGATEEEIKLYLNQSHNQSAPRGEFPIGIALIGLIPMGVGMAYLIYYRGESQRAPEIS
jgi:hypothetical protein